MISAPVTCHAGATPACLPAPFAMIREPIGLPAVRGQGRNSSPGRHGSVAEWFKAELLELGGTPQVRILSLPFKEFSSGIEQRIPNPWTVV